MQNFMFKTWVKTQMLKQTAKDKVRSVKEHLMSEEGGADSIIIAVIIILVVVVLGFVFKDFIVDWFNKLTGSADEQINSGTDTSNWGVNTPGNASST